MVTQDFDIIVVGAGMAGSTAAAHLAPHKRVALVEAEDAPGYHTTGRSAAIWMLNYGPPDVRVLTGLSRGFLQAPPAGFAEHPLVSHRAVIFLAPEHQRAQLDQMLAEGIGLQRLTVEAAAKMVPALRPDYAVAAAIEQDGFDLDVAAIQQGFLRQLRAAGGTLALRSRAGQIERRGSGWDVHTSTGVVFHAPVIINASGAWGDEVAAHRRGSQARPDALPAHCRDHRSQSVRGRALADDQRLRPHLVRAAGGTHSADGLPG